MRIARILIAGLIGAAGVAAQNPEFTLKVDVQLVSLDVEVMDPVSGKPVTNLTRDDFIVFEDGKPQEIRNFAPADAPYNILAMFDCTGSLQDQWKFLRTAMNRFAESLRPQDRVAIVAFGAGSRMLRNWMPRNELRMDFQIPTEDRVCYDTDFYGAMSWAATNVKGIDGRKGVIVFTDGVHEHIPRTVVNVGGLQLPRFVDAADDKDFQLTMRSVSESGALFYFVAVNTDLNPGTVNELLHPVTDYSPAPIYNMQQVRMRMELLARESGGRIVFPLRPSDYAALYERIATELGSSYSLGYAPPNASGPSEMPGRPGNVQRHQIEVRVKDAALRVRQSRDSYGVQ